VFEVLTNWYDHVPFEILDVAQRIQINTGAGYRASIAAIRAFPANIRRALDRGYLRNVDTIIFQWDGVNSDVPFAVASHGFNVAVLFDKSGGAGRYTAEIPDPHPILPTGFAGGLGPETVLWAICELDVWKKPYWVDMEGNVRTADNRLDIEAVQRVLQVGAECQSPSTASASAIG
jgi:phosphoribosylanthranilate isomerase